MIFATGIRRSSIMFTFQWEPQMNYLRLAFAWMSFITLVVLIVVTVRRFRKKKYENRKMALSSLIVSWVVLVIIRMIAMIWPHTEWHGYLWANILSMYTIYTIISIVQEWASIVALTVALVNSVRFICTGKV